jgi:hypothetical protein
MTLVAQLSVFVEDKVGRVAEICGLLGAQKINIVGFDIADSAEGFGILRIVVDDMRTALDLMHRQNVTARETSVVCVVLTYAPGSLAEILRRVGGDGLNIEYLYAGANNHVFLHTNDNPRAAALLAGAGYAVVAAFERK